MTQNEKAMERLEDALNEFVIYRLNEEEKDDQNKLFNLSVKAINEFIDDGALNDEIEGCIVYTKDCEDIVIENGLHESLRDYRDEYGEHHFPMVNDLARMILYNMFTDKYDGLTISKLAIEISERLTEVN